MFSKQTTEVHATLQQSSRGRTAVDHIVLHHAATVSMDAVLSMMITGSRQVSSNYVVKDSRIASVVPEELRSWSLGDAPWDARSITFEIANSDAGDPWPVSPASHESVARVVADIGKRYKLPINRATVIGHREVYSIHGGSYATACPGGLDLDWIVARANQILKPPPPMKEVKTMDYRYIWDGKRYALLHPELIKGGSIVSDQRTDGETFAIQTGDGPKQYTPAQFDRQILFAARLSAMAHAERQAQAAIPDPTIWGKAAASSFAAALPKFTASGQFSV